MAHQNQPPPLAFKPSEPNFKTVSYTSTGQVSIMPKVIHVHECSGWLKNRK